MTYCTDHPSATNELTVVYISVVMAMAPTAYGMEAGAAAAGFPSLERQDHQYSARSIDTDISGTAVTRTSRA
jgi:hypothetical protein